MSSVLRNGTILLLSLCSLWWYPNQSYEHGPLLEPRKNFKCTREEGTDASRPPRHDIQEAVSPGRVWSDACGGRHLGTSFWEESSVPWWLLSLGTTLWAGFFPTFGETGRERPSKASHGESENRRPHSDPNQEAPSHQPSCCGLWGKSHCFLCT